MKSLLSRIAIFSGVLIWAAFSFADDFSNSEFTCNAEGDDKDAGHIRIVVTINKETITLDGTLTDSSNSSTEIQREYKVIKKDWMVQNGYTDLKKPAYKIYANETGDGNDYQSDEITLPQFGWYSDGRGGRVLGGVLGFELIKGDYSSKVFFVASCVEN